MNNNRCPHSGRLPVLGLILAATLAAVPVARAADDNFRFVVIGDSRKHTCDYNGPAVDCINVEVMNRLNQDIIALDPKPAFVIVNGDLARYGATRFYEAFHKVMEPVRNAGIPYYVTFGNHELHTTTTQSGLWYQGQVDFQKFFTFLPKNGPPGYEYLAYSFKHKNAFFLIVDTFFATATFQSEEPYIAPEQYTWIDEETAKANADPSIVHKFAISHAPVFSAESAKFAPYTQDLWTGFDNNGYDAFFGAHEHLYARLKVNQLVERPASGSAWHGNVFHVIAGVAGGPLDETPLGNTDVTQVQFGYTVVDVRGADLAVSSFNFDDAHRAFDSFALSKNPLTVAKTGTGNGTIVSDQPTPYIDCGPLCAGHFNSGAMVTLTATPDVNSIFTGWRGACWGMDPTCTVTLGGATNVSADFGAKPALIVRKLGYGKDWGTVTSATAGIDCGPTCTVQTNPGAQVVLKATPAPGARFNGWTGACTGASDTCTLTMNANQSVLATFGAAP